ncbi:MAG TPA: VWA domain-containing protein [Nannocystis exedens]|nr:VWA domain-containing protein [Nannocystis exedens]
MSRALLFLRIVGFAALALVISAALLGGILGGDLRHISFAKPLWALAALVPLAAVVVRVWRWPRPATLRFSRARTAARMRAGIAARIVDLPDGFRLAAALLLALALARPQSTRIADRLEHEGIDIAIALDLSDSMESPDLYPNRLEAAKQVIDDFIARRPHDRIAVVAFGATASTVAPLTLDHDVVRLLVRKLELGGLDGTRTAIGAGIGVSLNRLAESEAKSKVLVLLTDGVHNAEGIDPDSAAQEAADRDVQIYTVLIGRHTGQNIDPGRLERMASATGGYAYTAEDREALTTSFQDLLNKLEKSVIDGEPVRAELFAWLLWPALLLLGADVLLRTTRLRRFP